MGVHLAEWIDRKPVQRGPTKSGKWPAQPRACLSAVFACHRDYTVDYTVELIPLLDYQGRGGSSASRLLWLRGGVEARGLSVGRFRFSSGLHCGLHCGANPDSSLRWPRGDRAGRLLWLRGGGSSASRLWWPRGECSNYITGNTRRWPNDGLMLAHCLRRWPDIKPALDERIAFPGL